MLAQDMQPASIVEDAGFQSLVQLLDSRYLLPSRRTLMRQLPELHSKRVCEIKQELSSTPCEALTNDIWTSTTTQSYLTLTYHFITSSWEMKSLVLETFDFCNNHTADNIAEALQRDAGSWGISSNVITVVTDNAANIAAAARIVGWQHVPCFAPTLNLVLSAALKDGPVMHNLQKRCKQIVTFFIAAWRPLKSWKRYRSNWAFQPQAHSRCGNKM